MHFDICETDHQFQTTSMSHNVEDIDPPNNPPKDWRMKCESLLPEGKVWYKLLARIPANYQQSFRSIGMTLLIVVSTFLEISTV